MLQFSRTNAIYAPLVMTLILGGCDGAAQTPRGSEAAETERAELEQRISANPENTELQLRLLDLEIDQGGLRAIELLERILDPDAESAFPTFIGKGAKKNETRFTDEYDLAYRLMRLYEQAGQMKKLHALGLRIAQPATTDNRFSLRNFELGLHSWRSRTQVTGDAAIAIALQHADTAENMSELKTALENSPWRSSRNQLHRRMNPADDEGLTAIGWANVPDGVQLIASSHNVLSLASDAEYIYSGHPWGVAVYDHTGKPVTRIALGAAVRVLATSHDCVWAGTPAGLFRIVRQDWSVAYQDLQGDIQSAARFSLTGDPIADRWIFSSVWDLAVDGDSLWIGTQRNVQRLNMQTLQLHVYSQSELGIRQGLEFERIEVDEKYVWAASSSLGIRRYDRATDTWAAPDSIGPREPVQFVDIVDGRVFGDAYLDDTRRHRLCMIDPVTMSVTLIPLAKDDSSKTISWPMNFNGKQNGELVFGGFRFDAANSQMVARTDSERESAADRQGDRPARKLREPSHAYIFSLHDKIDRSLRHQRRPALRDGVTVDLPDGRRVLGLRQNAIRYEYPREDIPESNVPYDKRPGGLFVVDEDVTEISAVPASDAIHGDLVQSIGFGQGEAWVCTSAGIAKLDQNNHVRTTFTRRDGLIHECVTDAAEKFGKWYFATGRRGSEGGLAIFDPETTIFTSLTTLDGLPINTIKSIRSKGDQLELTVGHERRRAALMSDLNYRTYPPLSFDPRTNRLGPIGEPILINERDAMSQIAKGKGQRVPFLGGHQVQKLQHNGHTYLCGTRGLVIIDDDGGDEQNPAELKFTDLKVKIVSSQIDQLIAYAERRKGSFGTPQELVQALKDSNRYYRANALASLLTKGNPLRVEYLPAVASQLQEKNVRLRSTALFLLTRFADDKQVVPQLKAHLNDEAQHLRAFATIELSKRGVMPDEKYRQEVRELGHSLHGHYPWGANSSIHVDLTPQQLTAATARHADADHFAWLLKSPPRVGRDSEKSQTFVQLGKRVDQDPNSLDVLLNAGSTDFDLDMKQIEFVVAVFHNMNPEILPRLHRSLLSKDRRVRSNAARACGALKDPSSIEPLIKALDLESLLSRKSIVWALGELKSQQALPVLYDLYRQAKPIPVMSQTGFHPPKSVGFDDLPLDNLSCEPKVKPRLVDGGNSKRVYSGNLLTPGDILIAVAKIGAKYSQPFYRSVAVSVDVLGKREAAERMAEAPVTERAESIVVLKKLLDEDDDIVGVAIRSAVSLQLLGDASGQALLLSVLDSNNAWQKRDALYQLERLTNAEQVAFARTRLTSLANDRQVDDELRKLAKEILSRP